MRKFIPILLFVITLAIIATYVMKQKVGDVRPMILPPKNIEISPRENNNSTKVGVPPSIPLILPSGFTIGIFAQNVSGARAMV